MKQLLTLSGLLLASLATPAKAQTGDAQFGSVSREQLAVGIPQSLSSMNQERMAEPSKALSDSSAPSVAHDLGTGAAIGAVVGIGGGIIASKRKQSVEGRHRDNRLCAARRGKRRRLGSVGGLGRTLRTIGQSRPPRRKSHPNEADLADYLDRLLLA